jgi:hypothetical protein
MSFTFSQHQQAALITASYQLFVQLALSLLRVAFNDHLVTILDLDVVL